MLKRPLPGPLKFVLTLFSLWLLLWVFTPLWVSLSPVHQEFAAAQERYDVPIGALYYNDIPFINEAAMELRDTWRFLPRGPESARQATPPADAKTR